MIFMMKLVGQMLIKLVKYNVVKSISQQLKCTALASF